MAAAMHMGQAVSALVECANYYVKTIRGMAAEGRK